nr:immunoglobulin light chain junction region [Macaca mulatta]
CQQHNSYPPTC